MMSISFVLDSVAMPLVSVLGLFGNVLSIIILNNRRGGLDLNSSFTSLLICLAIFDSLFLLLANSIYTASALLPNHSSPHPLAIPYLVPLASIALTGSVYTVVAITIERYATLRQWHNRLLSARFLIIFIILLSVSYNFIKFFELTAEVVEVQADNLEVSEDTFFVNLRPTWLRIHPLYSLVYIMVINFLVMNLVPFVVLAVLNISIYKSVSRMTHVQTSHSDTTMAALLFSIVIVFLCCHSLKLGLNIYEGVQMVQYETIQFWPEWTEILARWSHLLLVINSSINIVIYNAKDVKFRKALLSMFQCKKGPLATATMPLDKIPSEVTREDTISETIH